MNKGDLVVVDEQGFDVGQVVQVLEPVDVVLGQIQLLQESQVLEVLDLADSVLGEPKTPQAAATQLPDCTERAIRHL